MRGAAEERLLRHEAGGQVADFQYRPVAVVGRVDLLLARGGRAAAQLQLAFHVHQRQRRGVPAALHGPQAGHRPQQRGRVRVPGRGEEAADVVGLDDAPAVHDDHALRHLGHDPHVVGDEDHGHAVLLLQGADQAEDLRLDGHVERGRRLVGDQDLRAAGERHGDHDPLAHAARQLVRVLVDPFGGVRDARDLEQLERLAGRLRARDVFVGEDRLLELVADREERVERGHRLLKDHRQVDPADFPRRGGREVGDVHDPAVALAQPDGAGVGAHLVQQPHDPAQGHGLAGSGLAHDRERLPPSHAEGDAVQDGAEPAVNREAQREVADGQDLVRRHRGMVGSAIQNSLFSRAFRCGP